MTKVTYKDEGDALREITSLGVRFARGVPREVPDRLLQKFRGNKHFEVEGMPFIDLSVQPDAAIDNSDAAVTGGAEEFWTVEQLTEILNERKVKIPASQKDNADALAALVEKNGGFPEEGEPLAVK